MINADKETLDNLARLGITPDAAQLERLELYARLVAEKNQRLNLTAAQDIREIWRRHVADGLCAMLAVKPRLKTDAPVIADVGAGAGFIGFALKIMLPQAQVHFIESVERKCAFLNWAAMKLGVRDVTAHCIRLDDKNPPVAADFALERAMGPLDNIASPCLSLVTYGGWFIAYQTQGQKCGIAHETIINYSLSGEQTSRALLLFRTPYGHSH